jgi:endonuclease YncB( thermonuclease family)
MFGMVPYWADTKLARQTYNARTETVATKPSFRNAFKRAQFCIVPANSFFEPEKMQAFGEKSKQSLSAMCFGQDAYYDAHAIDKYRRTVAVVSCGGVEVNRAQVERGMAWGYTKYNNDLPLLAIESQAAARRPLSACERSQAIWLLPARSSI